MGSSFVVESGWPKSHRSTVYSKQLPPGSDSPGVAKATAKTDTIKKVIIIDQLNMKITHGKFPTSAKKLEYGKLPT